MDEQSSNKEKIEEAMEREKKEKSKMKSLFVKKPGKKQVGQMWSLTIILKDGNFQMKIGMIPNEFKFSHKSIELRSSQV